jgi:hypothetical protein
VTETLSTTFMERHFGEDSQAVSAALVAAGNEAHTRSLDAKVGSRLKSNHAYGSTFWLALPQEVVARLLPILDDAVPFPPRGAPYELLVWNGIAILPVKVMESGKRDSRMRARISDLRSRLTKVNVLTAPEPTLFDDLDEFTLDEVEEEARRVAEAARSAIGNMSKKMVVAAYQCNPASGLRVVRVGIATLDADGHINFSDSEQLSLIESSNLTSKPTEVAGETFDAAPRPKPVLEVVREEKTAMGEDEPTGDPNTSAPE